MKRRHSGPDGFTLIELLVGLVLTAVVGGSVLLLLLRQSRFYRMSEDAVLAEQSLRATADLFGRELRSARASDLLAAAPDSVTLRADLHRGIVCATEAGSVTYLVYGSPPANLVGPHGTAVTSPYDSITAYDDGWDGYGTTASAGEREACREAGAPAGPAPSAYRTVAWSGTAIPRPARGARIRIYAPLSYRVAASRFTAGLAIWREGQELAAPFDSASFRYVQSDGSRVGAVPSGELDDVERIAVRLVATGDDPVPSGPERGLTYEVVLRN